MVFLTKDVRSTGLIDGKTWNLIPTSRHRQKINASWTTNRTVKCKTIKLLEYGTEEHLWEPEMRKHFVISQQKALTMKGDLDSVKIKNLFSFKDRARRINNQDMEQEKILITYIIKNRSVYRHIKNFYKRVRSRQISQ